MGHLELFPTILAPNKTFGGKQNPAGQWPYTAAPCLDAGTPKMLRRRIASGLDFCAEWAGNESAGLGRQFTRAAPTREA